MTSSGEYVDVRTEARRLGVAPVVLRRELLADDVPLVAISSRVHKVESVALEAWLQQRQQRTRDALQQQKHKADYVRGRTPAKRRPTFKRRP